MGLSIDDLEEEYVDALLRLATVFDVAAAAASGEARSAADLYKMGAEAAMVFAGGRGAASPMP